MADKPHRLCLEKQELVYKVLLEAACHRLPCPTNEVIAKALGMTSGRVCARMQRLAQDERIEIVHKTKTVRKVRIVIFDVWTEWSIPGYVHTFAPDPTTLVAPEGFKWPDYGPHNLKFRSFLA